MSENGFSIKADSRTKSRVEKIAEAIFVCTAFLGRELPENIAAVILLLAVMASCVWIGIASGFLRTNRMRIPYICVGIGFNVVLGLILLNFYIGLL